MTKGPSVTRLDSATILDLDLDGVKLIEASAGTGKTHTIADLYLRYVLAGRQPEQILVVTYTNAATEELRGRIRKRLYDALYLLDSPVDSDDEMLGLLQERWRNLDRSSQQVQSGRLQLALRSMDEAAISTIHSFCQRCLQEHALAAGQLFDTEMLTSDDHIWETAIKDWWRVRTYTLDSDTWRLIRSKLPQLDGLISTVLELRNKPSAQILPKFHMSLSELLAQPQEIARSLHQLAPLWMQHEAELSEILSQSKVLSRTLKLPYHKTRLTGFLEAADRFYRAEKPGELFADFQYLGSQWLDQNSMPSKQGQDPGLEHPFFQAVNTIAIAWTEFSNIIGPQLRADAFRVASRQVIAAKQEITALAFQDQLALLLDALESKSEPELAANIRRQYPVAMIDEFQDTDNVQYEIFKHIYLHDDTATITLIGDPKQAIYSFRGGDIFTYMQARRLPGVDLLSLQTNWRSQPRLVQAINTIFSHRPDPFIYQDSIMFSPVEAVATNQNLELQLEGRSTPAMTIWQLPQNENSENYSREEMRELINQAIVSEIAQLLEMAGQQSATIDGRSIQSGDIAILVRQASEGHALSRMLNRYGMRTVTIGRDSVFKSEEARGLYDLLLAISQYQDPVLASRSLSSNLLNLDYLQIAAIVGSDPAWQKWIEDLSALQQLWERHGFIAMFQSLLHRFEITSHLAQRDSNERRVTNLLHLAELLQQQSSVSAGMSPTLSWFQEQFDEDANEDAELRLEDDEALIKIVTIHKSKGLQYPIVFVPFLWSCKQVDRKRAVYFHDADLAACVDLGSSDLEVNWLMAEKERLAEDLRLLYVALTRARSTVYLAWGKAGASGNSGYSKQTAMAYLLHSRQSPRDLESTAADGFPEDMDFVADLDRLVDKSEKSIELRPLPIIAVTPKLHLDDRQGPAAQLSKFSRGSLPRWRINSFTALTRGIHQPANTGALISQGDPFLDFPAGSHVGLLIHSLLENLDFQHALAPQCIPLFSRFLPRSGLSSEYEQTLVAWLEQVLTTPLDGAALTLTELAGRQRLNELSFDFALDHLCIESLNRFMSSLSPLPLQAVSSSDFCGLVTGVIDLVFEYQGRYYLADYKTNLLGSSLGDYRPELLQRAMLERRYDLQSLLYSVALHRFLAQRLPDYSFEQHFGGCYYLFLRAMRTQHGNNYGVHFDRPEQKTIAELENLLKFTPLEAGSA